MVEFPIGYRNFHPNESINFQLNRWLPTMDENDVRSAANRLENLSDWKNEMLALAKQAEEGGELLHASTYFKAAAFYMSPDDEDKVPAYLRFIELFDEATASGDIERHEIAYQEGFIPAIYIKSKTRKKSTVVVHGGYDSSMEELLLVCCGYADHGHDVIFFEGPGQGQALFKHGLKMHLRWEEPVGVVLDYFEIQDCTLIGFSLGGFLAPRAAAYEPRVKRVVALDVLDDFFDCFQSKSDNPEAIGQLAELVKAGEQEVVNSVARQIMDVDEMTKWALLHGMHVSGSSTPYDFFLWLLSIKTEPFSELITQDFLLLAGSNDHIVPMHQCYRQAQNLPNVRSMTARVFTQHENADSHCQVGNAPLLNRYVLNWIESHLETL